MLTRAVRNISRRKMRALLVIIALGFSMAIMISIPAGVTATQKVTNDLTNNLANTITRTEQTINQTQKQIDCSLDPYLAGYGFQGYYYRERPDFSFGPISGGGGFDLRLDPWFWEYYFADVPSSPEKANLMAELFGRQATVPMQQSLYSDIASIEGVSAVQPILRKTTGHNETEELLYRMFTRIVPDYTIEGVQLTSDLVDNHPVLPTNITAGRNLQVGDSGVVLLSEELTAFFGLRVPVLGNKFIRAAEVGDTIKVLGRNFEVIGIFEPLAVENTITLYMNLSDAQSLTGNIGIITSMRVFAESSDVVTRVAETIKSKHPELMTNTAQQRLEQLQALKTSYNTTVQNAEDALNQTQSMAMKEIIVVVAATSLIVLFVMLYTVRERTKEIGTLKAIGKSNWTVMSQFMIEGTMLSLIAGVAGIAIGFFAAPMLSSILLPSVSSGPIIPTAETVVLDPQLMLLALGAAVLLGALGSLYPAWRASRTQPAEAMRYE